MTRDAISEANTLVIVLAYIALVWYVGCYPVSLIGYFQIRRYFSAPKPPSRASSLRDPPHVTIIRPIKGIEPHLYDCLAATFRQDYDQRRLTIFFCFSNPQDPALSIAHRLISDHSTFDARILIETEDEHLKTVELGPNPKIRNMSRAYREAKGDIVWIIDCNVWIAHGTLGRMVDTLQGQAGRPAKFVHLLPLVVDVSSEGATSEGEHLLREAGSSTTSTDSVGHMASPASRGTHEISISREGGGRLEEMFMSSAHAKWYTSINTILLAPCIVGKSTMFRRSHLNGLTSGAGIDYFSYNICEDHLIGDLLWKRKVPEQLMGEKWINHAMVFGDLAIQPMASMSMRDYIARRVRWLRVRKFTVALATFVEPGTESFLCSIYGAFALTTLGYLPNTWAVFVGFWLLSIAGWAAVDWTLYQFLHSGHSIEQNELTPSFARPPRGKARRSFKEWLLAWLGREALALPIWMWAVYGGVTVTWRGKDFWVGLDMKVHEIQKIPVKRRE